MPNSATLDRDQRRNAADRRAFVKRWAEYVRTHDDGEWSRTQNELVDAQLRTANEMAVRGDTDPVAFAAARDRLRDGELAADAEDGEAGDDADGPEATADAGDA